MNNIPSSASPFSWLSFVGIILLQGISGSRSIISAYPSQLERHFIGSQVQLNNLVVASDTGRLFGWVSSTASDHLPLWMILLVGLIFGAVGYGVQYLYLIQKIPSLSYWLVFLLNLIAGNSICWINTYCNLVATKHFKDNQTTIAGLTSSYSSLSGKIYMSLVEGIRGRKGSRNSNSFPLLRFLLPTVVGLPVAFLLSFPKLTECGELDTFSIVFVIASATGAYDLLESVAQPFKNMSPMLRGVVLVLAIKLPLAMPKVIKASWFALKKWVSLEVFNSISKRVIKVFKISCKGLEQVSEKAGEKVDRIIGSNVKFGDEHGVKELVMSLDFWLYFWVNACGVTLGMVYITNLRQISESRGKNEASSLLTISSTFGYLAKVFSVNFDWYLREKHQLSRQALTVLVMIPMPMSFFLLTIDSSISLYISTCILGTCSGAITAISPSTTSELFGCQNWVKNHNIILANIPICSLLLGHLAALNYDRQSGGENGICMGLKCHHRTFIIWGTISFVGTILSFILHLRTRKSFRN